MPISFGILIVFSFVGNVPALVSVAPRNGMDAHFLKRHLSAKVVMALRSLNHKGASDMKITTIGIDLAKAIFQIHGIDERGKAVLRGSMDGRQANLVGHQQAR